MSFVNGTDITLHNQKRRLLAGRWKRISQLSDSEEAELYQITEQTSGMTMYGNRARTSIMLPLELAREISRQAKVCECTVNQVVVDLLEQMLHSTTAGVKTTEDDTEH